MTATANVVNFKNNSFKNAFDMYMFELKKNSKNTHRQYMGNYKEFFMYVAGKEIEDVTWSDLLNITYNDIQQYRYYLTEIKNPANSNGTANRKIASLRSLWKEMRKTNPNINPRIMDLTKLKEEKVEGSEALTEKEAIQLIEFANNRDFKPEVQSAFFKVAIMTALRKDALLNATTDNLKQHKDVETGMLYWCIDVYDKTGEAIRPIRNDVYEELIELQDENYNLNMKNRDNRLFKISEDTLIKTLNDFCKEYEITRRITLHSLRKTSSDLANDIAEGDIKKIQQQTGHKNPQVLINAYQGTRESLSDFPGLMMFNDNLNVNDLNNYSKEEIIEAISKSSMSAIREIFGHLQ